MSRAVTLGVLVAFFLVGSARAEVATLELLVDTDRNTATGCGATAPDGTVSGIERRLRVHFDVPTETVLDVVSAGCLDPLTSTFESDGPVALAAPPPWSGTTGNGVAGSTLFEAPWPFAEFGPTKRIDVYASISSIVGADAVHGGVVGAPIGVSLGLAQVPGLEFAGGLAAFALTLGAGSLGIRHLRPFGAASVRRALALLGLGGGVALAANPAPVAALIADGVLRTWSPTASRTLDAEGDAPSGIDLRALWFQADPVTGELWVRADVAFGAPVCLDWGAVDPGMGFACSQEPPPDPGPFGGAVALTFDDGPNLTTTANIVATLRAYGVPATFFVKGSRLLSPAEQAFVLDLHHDPLFRIGNHTVSHPNMTTLTPMEMEWEIFETSDRIRTAIGDDCYFPEYFRFPYSASDCASIEVARSIGHIVTGFHFAPHDWCYDLGDGTCSASLVPWIPAEFLDDLVGYTVHTYLQSSSAGGILLLHDTAQVTADALPAIITGLEAEGATFVDLADPLLLPMPLLQSSNTPPEPPACCEIGP